MNQVKLGNDFTDEENSDSSKSEKEEKQAEENNSDEENENSTDSSNSENLNKSEESNSEEKSDDESEEKSDDDLKDKELQGLLDTEKGLDSSNASVDEAISAARNRISQKRTERREKRDIINTVDSKFPEEETDLSDIDSETLKVLDKYTRAKGLIPKSEVQKMNYDNQHESAENSFYEKHQEYDINNDPDNVLYNALRKELSYFSAPKDPRVISKLFEKAHREVIKLYPDKFKDEKKSDDSINKSVRLKSQSLGGKSSSGMSSVKSKEGNKEWSDVQINAMRQGGWSEEEIKDLLK